MITNTEDTNMNATVRTAMSIYRAARHAGQSEDDAQDHAIGTAIPAGREDLIDAFLDAVMMDQERRRDAAREAGIVWADS